MLTPMMVQYLVGLCCWKHDPDAVDIILGDMVYDSASESERDVDVTITIKDKNGTIEAFKAAEVKAESKPLDVAKVEQLCKKFEDLPEVTHKSIFSCSGYTNAAMKKAKKNAVDLYTMMPCDKPVGKVGEMLTFHGSALLFWENYQINLIVPNALTPFIVQPNTELFTHSGKKHKSIPNISVFNNNVLMKSTEILCTLEPALTVFKTFAYEPTILINDDYLVGPMWPHTHTLDVASYEVYLKLNGELCRIDSVTVTGNLQFKKRKVNPEFYVLRNAFSQEVFAGITIADYGVGDGRMCAITYSETDSELGIHPSILLAEKHRKKIHELKIK